MNCPACKSTNFSFLRKCTAQHLERGEYRLLECKDCCHIQAFGSNENTTLTSIYGESFFSTSAQNERPNSPASTNAKNRALRLNRQYNPKSTMDIGAGIGHFVRAMSKYSYTVGAEYSKYAATRAQQLSNNVVQLDFTSNQESINSKLSAHCPPFDLITLWDVLSCFEDQEDVLKKIAAFCKDGGTAVITIPICDSITAKVLGKYWPLWIPPVNQHYYTYKSIEALARSAGFATASIEKRGKLVSLDFILQKLFKTLGVSKTPNFLTHFSTITLPVNMYDIAEVHLVKKYEKTD